MADKKIVILLGTAFLLFSCSNQNNKRSLASGGRSYQVISKNDRSIETINFSNNRVLKIDAPEISCPIDLIRNPICFHSAPHKKNVLVIDPGHDLSLDSMRNGRHDEVHEGRSNMVVAVLSRLLLKKCSSFNQRSGVGIKSDHVFLSHYPGEKYYGDFEFGHNHSRRSGHFRIRSKGGEGLFDHVNELLDLKGRMSEKSVAISIHADAPDFVSYKDRYEEYPAVFFRRTRKNSSLLAMSLYESMVNVTLPYYDKEQRASFVIKKLDDGSYYYPMLTLLGVPNASSLNKKDRFRIYNEYVEMRIWKREIARILRAGVGDKYIDTKFLGRQSLSHSDLSPSSTKTEVALVEGYFMDGPIVGKKVQNDLSQKDAPIIKFSTSNTGIKNITALKFPKGKIERLSSKKNKISYRIVESGGFDEGLKISPLYIDYAKAVVLGLHKRYRCK